MATLKPPFPGLSQCPRRGYVWQAPDEPFKNQADRLPKATDIQSMHDIPILDDKSKFVHWMCHVQAALDYHGMGQLINPNLDRPHGKLSSKKYENWRALASRVSGWMRLHISDDMLEPLIMTQRPTIYPDELICVLAQFCSSTLLNSVGNRVFQDLRRTDFHTRMQYLESLKMRLDYSRRKEERVDLREMMERALDSLKDEILLRVHAENEVVAHHSFEHGDYPGDAQFCIDVINRLLEASR